MKDRGQKAPKKQPTPPTAKGDDQGVCECKVCSMGYPCGRAHRRFMESQR